MAEPNLALLFPLYILLKLLKIFLPYENGNEIQPGREWCIQMFPITKPVIASELHVSVWSSK